tara:strand:- start:1409 stop:1672 length:264 start_codon:yes stop_codon:yes gene_type:complete
MKEYEFKVIINDKETFVVLQAEDVQSALEMIVDDEEVSKVLMIKEIDGYLIQEWTFGSDIQEMRRIKKDAYYEKYFDKMEEKDEIIH